jgi:hypothetical protein
MNKDIVDTFVSLLRPVAAITIPSNRDLAFYETQKATAQRILETARASTRTKYYTQLTEAYPVIPKVTLANSLALLDYSRRKMTPQVFNQLLKVYSLQVVLEQLESQISYCINYNEIKYD